jgi:hypothetical protein
MKRFIVNKNGISQTCFAKIHDKLGFISRNGIDGWDFLCSYHMHAPQWPLFSLPWFVYVVAIIQTGLFEVYWILFFYPCYKKNM